MINLLNKTFISYGVDKYSPYMVKPIDVNSRWGKSVNKPHGGLWASPVDSEFGWGDFCNRDAFNLKTLSKHFLFKLKKDSNILIIDSADDLVHNSIYDRDAWKCILDFKKIVRNYDGIYISDNAASRLRYDIKLKGKDVYVSGLNAWDVESICIWNAEVIEPLDEDAFERADYHKYEKPLYTPDDEEYYYGFDNLSDRKTLQMDADFERYRNTNVEDSRKLFKGEHPGLLAQKHGNSKDAKLARRFDGTIKSGLKNESRIMGNKNVIRLNESELRNIIKESVLSILNETSFNKAKDAYYQSYDNVLKGGPKVSDRKFKQMDNLYGHMNDRRHENIDMEMPVKIVGGKMQGNYIMKDIMEKFPINGYMDAFRNSAYRNSKIVGYPRISGYVGPMWDGDCIRYESPDVYDELSQ